MLNSQPVNLRPYGHNTLGSKIILTEVVDLCPLSPVTVTSHDAQPVSLCAVNCLQLDHRGKNSRQACSDPVFGLYLLVVPGFSDSRYKNLRGDK